MQAWPDCEHVGPRASAALHAPLVAPGGDVARETGAAIGVDGAGASAGWHVLDAHMPIAVAPEQHSALGAAAPYHALHRCSAVPEVADRRRPGGRALVQQFELDGSQRSRGSQDVVVLRATEHAARVGDARAAAALIAELADGAPLDAAERVRAVIPVRTGGPIAAAGRRAEATRDAVRVPLADDLAAAVEVPGTQQFWEAFSPNAPQMLPGGLQLVPLVQVRSFLELVSNSGGSGFCPSRPVRSPGRRRDAILLGSVPGAASFVPPQHAPVLSQ